MRGSGDTRSPMLIFGLVSLMNLILSPLLVFGLGPIPAFGVDGIVFGTILARISGGVLMFVTLSRGLSGLKLLRKEFTLRGDLVLRILRIGAPAAMDGVIIWTAQIFFLKICAVVRSSPVTFARRFFFWRCRFWPNSFFPSASALWIRGFQDGLVPRRLRPLGQPPPGSPGRGIAPAGYPASGEIRPGPGQPLPGD